MAYSEEPFTVTQARSAFSRFGWLSTRTEPELNFLAPLGSLRPPDPWASCPRVKSPWVLRQRGLLHGHQRLYRPACYPDFKRKSGNLLSDRARLVTSFCKNSNWTSCDPPGAQTSIKRRSKACFLKSSLGGELSGSKAPVGLRVGQAPHHSDHVAAAVPGFMGYPLQGPTELLNSHSCHALCSLAAPTKFWSRATAELSWNTAIASGCCDGEAEGAGRRHLGPSPESRGLGPHLRWMAQPRKGSRKVLAS